MPDIGDRIRITYRDGRKVEAILRDIIPDAFPYIIFEIELDSGERKRIVFNDGTISCVETVEEK